MVARRSRVRGMVLALTVLLVTLLPVGSASACSCAMMTPEEALETSSTAFVGQVVSRTPVGDLFGEEAFRWTFEVDQVLAGELGPTVDVVAAADNGGNCGLNPPAGPVGLILYPNEAGWSSGTCATYEAAALLAAGEPYPPDPSLAAPPSPTSSSGGVGAWLPLAATVAGAGAVLAAAAVVVRRRRDTLG